MSETKDLWYRDDDENFDCQSIEEAIFRSGQHSDGDEVVIESGESGSLDLSFNAYTIIEQIQEFASEQVGELADQVLQLSDKQEKDFNEKINAFVSGWIEENDLTPRVFPVKNICEIKVLITNVENEEFEIMDEDLRP